MWFEELRLGGGLTNVAQTEILPVKAHSRMRVVRATTGLEPASSHGSRRSSLGQDALPVVLHRHFGVTEELLRWPQPLRVAVPWGSTALHDEERGSHVR